MHSNHKQMFVHRRERPPARALGPGRWAFRVSFYCEGFSELRRHGVLRSSSWQTEPRPPLHIALARMAGTQSPKNCRLGPFSNLLSGEHEGENVGGLATIERRKCSPKRRCAMADRSEATNPTRREPRP